MPRKTHVFQSNDYTEANVRMRNQVYFKALGLSSNVTLNTKLFPQRAVGKGYKHVRGRHNDRDCFGALY